MAEVDVITRGGDPVLVTEVAAFAADPSNAPLCVDWKTVPPVQIGSGVAFVAWFLGRRMAYTYEVIEYEPRGAW